MFQTSYLGFLFAGPAFIWAWPFVLFGQFMVALQFAELSAHYPLAGSIYRWSKQMSSKTYAWHNGWIYLCAQIVTIPAVSVGWQIVLPQISTKFQIIKCSPVAADSTCPDKNFPTYLDPAFAKNGLLLGAIMILLTTIINIAGVQVMSRINNVGVAAELIGAAGLIIIYMIHIHNGPSVLFETDGTGAGHAWGWFGALLIGAIMPLYVMYGFDTAGSLAEETDDPRRRAPRAVLQALATAGIMGFLLIAFGIMAVSDQGVANLGATGLTGITTDVLGSTWGKVFLVDVALAIFVCCLAIHAMSVRILFAMGRDNSLPFARQRERLRQPPRAGGPCHHLRRHRAADPGLQHQQPESLHDHHLDGHHPDVHRVPDARHAVAAQATGGMAGQPARPPRRPVPARPVGEASRTSSRSSTASR